MEKLTHLNATVAPLARANVDTDQIIPKQFLRAITRTGFGQFLFDEWRYLDQGELGMDCAARPKNTDFVLNDERYQDAQILLTQKNFGCGSSREHAVWALMEYGFRVVIAPSFGDIFQNNALKNGLLPIALPADAVDTLLADADKHTVSLGIDVAAQTVTDENGNKWQFTINAADKSRLLEGLDDIALTLKHGDEIRAYEKERRQAEPWLFND